MKTRQSKCCFALNAVLNVGDRGWNPPWQAKWKNLPNFVFEPPLSS